MIGAPLAGVTTPAFRRMVRRFFDGLIYTEMVSVEGLRRHVNKTIEYLQITDSDKPIGIQLFGGKPEGFTEAIAFIKDNIPTDIVDINMGCPVKKVLKSGSGSAMMKDPQNAGKVIAAARKALGDDALLTVKMRLGWDKNSLNCNEMIHIAYEEGAEAVTLHGRTKTDMYSGHVNYDLIAEAKSKAKLPIIGNGDILDYESYQKMLATGVDGVMIGRGMMKQPWIFASIAAESDPNGFLSTDELYSLIRDMIEYEKEFKGDRKFLETIKKYIVWFLKGLPNVTPFRNTLFTLRTEEQIINLLDDYFEQVNQSIICSMSDEAVG